MKRIIVCCILIIIAIPVSSQWLIEGWDEKRTVLADLMPKDAHFINNYVFFGPSRLLSENVVTKATAPFSIDSDGRIKWEIDFQNPYPVPAAGSNSFYFNFYSENISSCTFIFESVDRSCLQKRVELLRDKYQSPIEFPLSKDNLSACTATQSGKEDLQLKRIVILLQKRDTALDYKCLVAECQLFDLSLQRKPAQGAFFFELTKQAENAAPGHVFTKFGSSYPITQYTSFTNLSIPEYYFIPDSIGHSNPDWREKTLELLKYFIDKYPYYGETSTNKQAIVSEADHIIRSAGEFEEKVNRMNRLMKELHDGHFYIEPGNATKPVIGPLLARKIKGEIQVVGIFNEELKKTVQAGMTITGIDGVPVSRYLDSASEFYYGNAAERREAAIARLFYRTAADSMRVTLQKADQEATEVMIRFNKSSNIPKNFRSEHFKFIVQPNSWAYLKLSRWSLGDWINFFNLGDTLKNMNGIIFDLRGNGGGSEIEAIRIFSCFIKKPTVFCYDTYQTVIGPRIAAPNKFLDLRHLKVMVLVDGKTACASELFAASLKKNCSATIIGSERTYGAYANAAYMYLPYGIVVKTNILSKTFLTADRTFEQHKGLQPDLVVEINSYKDLVPYEDKVLKDALMLTSTPAPGAKRYNSR